MGERWRENFEREKLAGNRGWKKNKKKIGWGELEAREEGVAGGGSRRLDDGEGGDEAPGEEQERQPEGSLGPGALAVALLPPVALPAGHGWLSCSADLSPTANGDWEGWLS